MNLRRILIMTLSSVSIWGCQHSSVGFFGDREVEPFNEDGFGLLDELEIQSPAVSSAQRLFQIYSDDGVIDDVEARQLTAFTKKFVGHNDDIEQYLFEVAKRDIVSMEARDILVQSERLQEDLQVPLDNRIYRLELGSEPFLFDDDLFLKFDGSVEGSTGILSHSRGYAAKRDGVLFKRHGSNVPHYSSTNSLQQTESIQALGPDQALDIAAEIYGLSLDQWSRFESIAHDPNFYDPSDSTPFWAGICQGWTHNALDDRINLLVDVEGEEGRRGLWIFGQWISRADLGNAMMGVSYSLGIADSITIDSFVTPENWIKALAQHVLYSGAGLRVDIWNDEHNPNGIYDPQIWNQPVVDASIEVRSVSTQVQSDIIRHAKAQYSGWGNPEYHAVKLVTAVAQWGTEANDDWEGDPLFKHSTWNMYLLTNFEGRVLTGFMANDLPDSLTELPVRESDGLPDYVAVPKHELTDAAFFEEEHFLLDDSNPEGLRYQFLVGTVLARGIPDTIRRAFEAEVFGGEFDVSDLQDRYPGIANAYSPTQWRDVFFSRLGGASGFGAVWGRHSQ